MKNKILLILILLVMCFAADAHAFVSIDFEGVPLTYYYKDGNQNLGSYYPGVYFGTDVTILDKVILGYNWVMFPPHSGNAVMYTDVSDGDATFTFDNPISYFEGYFTANSPLHFYAYNLSGALVTELHVQGNTGEFTDPPNRRVILTGLDIKNIRVDGYHDCWVADDIMFDGNSTVPEPATLALFAIGLLGVGLRRRVKTGVSAHRS